MSAATKEQMRGNAASVPADPPPPAPPDEVEHDDAADAAPGAPKDDGKLPAHVVEEPSGVWVYTLQDRLRPSKIDPDGTLVEKVKISPVTYAGDVLEATRQAGDDAGQWELNFHLVCVLTSTPPDVMQRVSNQDFQAISDALQLQRLRRLRRKKRPT